MSSEANRGGFASAPRKELLLKRLLLPLQIKESLFSDLQGWYVVLWYLTCVTIFYEIPIESRCLAALVNLGQQYTCTTSSLELCRQLDRATSSCSSLSLGMGGWAEGHWGQLSKTFISHSIYICSFNGIRRGHAVMQYASIHKVFTMGAREQDALVGVLQGTAWHPWSPTTINLAHHHSARHLPSSTKNRPSSVSPQDPASWTIEVAKSLGHSVELQTGPGTTESLNETARTSNILQ